jgi:hypothetical protein
VNHGGHPKDQQQQAEGERPTLPFGRLTGGNVARSVHVRLFGNCHADIQ